MLTNEASYSIHIPAILASFPEEAQAMPLHRPSGRLPWEVLTLWVSRLGLGYGGASLCMGAMRCWKMHNYSHGACS